MNAVKRKQDDEDEQAAAEKKRKDQGCHECEVFSGGIESFAYEGARAWHLCQKNPGHQSFIPYSEFSPEHLPEDYKTLELYTRVKAVADLAVRVRVGYTSTERPSGYPFHNYRGSSIVHTGSGFCVLFAFSQFPVKLRREHYPDHYGPGCAHSDAELEELYEIQVVTARHVVYNKEEAKSTRVDFFYDDEKSEFNGKMKTIHGYDFKIVQQKDICILRCVTNDKGLVDQLGRARMTMYEDIKERKAKEGSATVVVSHPHGRPKYITVGEAKQKDLRFVVGPLTYATSTCPGSSGAPVMWLSSPTLYNWFYNTAVHSRGGVKGSKNQGNLHLFWW